MNNNIKKATAVIIAFFFFNRLYSKPTTENGNSNGNTGGNSGGFVGWSNIVNPQIMRNDTQGHGHYLASRGSRKHKGVDLVCYHYQPVFAPFDGIITRSFNVYSSDTFYKGVELSDQNGTKVKIMYIYPNYALIGQYVYKGQQIATCQKISNKYSSAMIDHVHVEKWLNGTNVNPSNDLKV